MNVNLGLSAVATGTSDVITATYSPAPTLVDKKILFLRAIESNKTTTPTFNPNSLGAKVITKKGGTALSVGDISGAGFVACLQYESANNRWVLLNPDDARSRKLFAYENTTQSHTGNTTETIKINKPLPASTIGANGVLHTRAQVSKSGVVGTGTFKVYLSPNDNSIVGATVIAQTTLTALQLKSGMRFRLTNKNSESLNEIYNTASNTDDAVANTAYGTVNIDTSVNLWLVGTITNSSSLDTSAFNNIQFYIDNP